MQRLATEISPATSHMRGLPKILAVGTKARPLFVYMGGTGRRDSPTFFLDCFIFLFMSVVNGQSNNFAEKLDPSFSDFSLSEFLKKEFSLSWS